MWHRMSEIGDSLGVKPVDPKTLDRVVQRFLDCPECAGHDLGAHLASFGERYGLSRRERDVLALAMAGKSRHEMAEQLNLTEATVKALTSRLLRKTGDKGLAKLVARVWATRAGKIARRDRDNAPYPSLTGAAWSEEVACAAPPR
jgi:DNA-binding CsgD family transcriptional regulator